MKQTDERNKRIAKNTLVLYFRMLFLMLVSLYTNRVILDALGVEDYGIYNVVGGFVAIFGLVSGALTNACSRFLNFELGKGDKERLKDVFSTSLTIQWVLAIFVAVLAEAIGVWYVNHVMVLPATRLWAANLCFHFSVFNFCMNLVTVPYNASLIAHEKMKPFAYIGIIDGLGKLVIAYLVILNPIDRLVYYAFLLLILQFAVRMLYQVYCRQHFEECHYKRTFDKPLLKFILSYTSWHLIGNGAAILKTHGVNIVLNLFFGASVNAAKGVANQVDTAVKSFVNNFMMAMSPAITQSFAKGNLQYMITLVNKGARFSFYLIFLLSLPIILKTDFLMHIWLKEVPENTVIFVQLSLIATMVSALSRTLITAQNATGNVRNYQLVVGGIQLLNLPLGYMALWMGCSPASVIIVTILVELFSLLVRLYMIPLTIPSFSPVFFLKDVMLRGALVVLLSIILPWKISHLMDDNFLSFIVVSFVCVVLSACVILIVGCSKSERLMIYAQVKKVKKRLKER